MFNLNLVFLTYLMKKTVSTETDDIESSKKIEKIIANTSMRLSDHPIEKTSSNSVTSEEVAGQIKAVSDPLTRQLERLCKLMRKLENEQLQRDHLLQSDLVLISPGLWSDG